MTNQVTRGKAKIGAIAQGGYAAKVLKTFPFKLTLDDFDSDGGAKGTATLTNTIPVTATFDHMAVEYAVGFLGNGSALTSWGSGGDVDRYHAAGSINLFGTATNGISVGAPSGTVYHNAVGTVSVIIQGTSAFSSIQGGTVSGYMAFWYD